MNEEALDNENIQVVVLDKDDESNHPPNVHNMQKIEMGGSGIGSIGEFGNYEKNIKNILFTFVNPISGNQEGNNILSIAKNHTKSDGCNSIFIPGGRDNETIIAIIFNLIDKDEYSKALVLLKRLTKPEIIKDDTLKILIAGGDGTVLSVVQGLDEKGIDIKRCVFGHIPLGTGNDLANCLGFGNSVSLSDEGSLFKVLEKYSEAEKCKVDVWNLELNLDEKDGKMIESTKNGKIIKKDNDGNVIKNYKRVFINYASLGYDARVGYNFDKKRTSSRCCNKCVYFWEGIKKNFFRKTAPISAFLESFTVFEDSNNENEKTFLSKTQSLREEEKSENVKIKFCFKPKSKINENDMKHKNIIMKGHPCSLVCQNINFYMAGCKDIWGKSKEHLALKVIGTNKEKEYENKLKVMAREQQRLDDKKLEFFTYANGFKIGMEAISTGNAEKLYHGTGPVLIKFAEDYINNDDEDKFNRIYLNIDGEYFNIVRPLSIRIELARQLNEGSLPFLTYREFKVLN